jgi:transposase
VSLPTVRKWRSRFLARRLDGLVDEPRPGRTALVSADRVEQAVIDTLESMPKNATHWRGPKMAEKSGLSK